MIYHENAEKPEDYVEAASRFRSAANKGHAGAQYNLGVMYVNGGGLRRDYVEALRWFEKASNEGHAGARYNLGIMHLTGSGVPKDYASAYAWVSLAAAGGNKQAEENLENILIRMTSEEKEKARALIKEWTNQDKK